MIAARLATLFPSDELQDYHYRNKSISFNYPSTLAFIYDNEYPLPIAQLANEDPARYEYCTDPMTLISAFIGLPTKRLDATQPQSIKNLIENLCGVQRSVSTNRAIFNGLISPLIFFLNLLFIPFYLAKNIAKLAAASLTKVLVLAINGLINFVNSAGNALQRLWYWDTFFATERLLNRSLSLVLVVMMVSLGALVVSLGISLMASAFLIEMLLSPTNSIKLIWRIGSSAFENPSLNFIVGSLLSALFASFIALSYAVVFPVVLPGIGAAFFSLLGPGFANFMGAIAGVIGPTLATIGQSVLAPLFGPLSLTLATYGIGVTSAAGALGLIVGLALTTLGPVLSNATLALKDWWHHSAADPELAGQSDSVAPPTTPATIRINLANNSTPRAARTHQHSRSAPSNTATFEGLPAFQANPLTHNDLSGIDFAQFNEHTRNYLKARHNQPKLGYLIDEAVKAHNLSKEEEESLFADFIDPITLSYMNVPVGLNEKSYDLSSVIKINEEFGKDSFTNEAFDLMQIQSNQSLVNKCGELINNGGELIKKLKTEKLKAERENTPVPAMARP